MGSKALLPTVFLGTLTLMCQPVNRAGDQPRPSKPSLKVSFANGEVQVINLSPEEIAELDKAKLTLDQWKELFAVRVESKEKNPPALLGSYEIKDGRTLVFQPRFPPARGMRYQVIFNTARLPGRTGKEEPVVVLFQMPERPRTATTVVEHVYPTRDKLPENQLKFYLHFSAPMSRGDVYKYIHLLDATGKPVAHPFLELDQELWDPEARRFTLFFDPGRIKRGLKSREEAGPSLEEGKSYTLVIDREWADGEGNPLKEPYRKKFSVLPPTDQLVEPTTWKIQAPKAGTMEPVTVTFPTPLDHALLHRMIWVTDAKGEKVAGTIKVSEEETRWQFTPPVKWQAGKYSIVADTRLEDLAGNSIEKPFEIDVFKRVQRGIKAQTVAVGFEVKD